MKNNNLIRFVQSLIFLPVMTMPMLFGGIQKDQVLQDVLVKKVNTESALQLAQREEQDAEIALNQERKVKADAIDTYFSSRNMPMAGTGMTMVLEAEKNDLDWRLLPAIAVRESTGGKNACEKVKYNSFGWGSCKIGFKSNAEAIKTVAKNLGGNNPNTAHHYDEKTTKQILRAYNPPSVVPKYAEQVISIMDAIGKLDIIPSTPESSSDPLARKA